MGKLHRRLPRGDKRLAGLAAGVFKSISLGGVIGSPVVSADIWRICFADSIALMLILSIRVLRRFNDRALHFS